MVSIPFLHRGVFRAGSSLWGSVRGWVSIPFLHRGVFRVIEKTDLPGRSFRFNPLSSSGRLQGMRQNGLSNTLYLVSIPFLHRGVFRAAKVKSCPYRRGYVSIPFLHRGVFRVDASAVVGDTPLGWFQSPFFIGASSGAVRVLRASSSSCFNPLSSSGRLQGRFVVNAVGSTLAFQSPFFIGASSGRGTNRTTRPSSLVSIPFLHRGVFREDP